LPSRGWLASKILGKKQGSTVGQQLSERFWKTAPTAGGLDSGSGKKIIRPEANPTEPRQGKNTPSIPAISARRWSGSDNDPFVIPSVVEENVARGSARVNVIDSLSTSKLNEADLDGGGQLIVYTSKGGNRVEGNVARGSARVDEIRDSLPTSKLNEAVTRPVSAK
jgi:hypothetical protein